MQGDTQINPLKFIDDTFAAAVQSGAMPGLVAMAADGGGLLYEGAYGARKMGGQEPMTLDTVVWIASMTKAITTTAAMQLVERGKLHLDRPAGEVIPDLGATQVLEGFDVLGMARQRPPRRPVTLRNLLTHTAGFCYDMFNPLMGRYMATTDTPPVRSCRNVALTVPLVFDPGERWEYGINIDWVGKLVEVASGQRLDRYFQEHILGPLRMHDTSFNLSPSQNARLASVHARGADGMLAAIDFSIPQEPEFQMGGGGLYSSAGDYLKFTQMLMRGGQYQSATILKPETVDLMAQNHIGDLDVGFAKSYSPAITNDVDWFGGVPAKWGLGFLINTARTQTGREAGSLAWAGLANTYYWIDHSTQVCGVFISQVLPFFDRTAMDLFTRFETAVYRSLR